MRYIVSFFHLFAWWYMISSVLTDYVLDDPAVWGIVGVILLLIRGAWWLQHEYPEEDNGHRARCVDVSRIDRYKIRVDSSDIQVPRRTYHESISQR